MLLKEREGIQGASQLVKAFFKSSVVIGILLGIALNVAGARPILYDFPVTAGIMAMLQFLANLTIPLILIIIGYGIKFDRYCLREISTVILARLAILIPLVLVVNIVLIQGLLQLEKPFEIGLFTLFILPPFIIPLYIRPDLIDEKRYVNNVLTIYTVVSIGIFTLYLMHNPGGVLAAVIDISNFKRRLTGLTKVCANVIFNWLAGSFAAFFNVKSCACLD